MTGSRNDDRAKEDRELYCVWNQEDVDRVFAMLRDSRAASDIGEHRRRKALIDGLDDLMLACLWRWGWPSSH